MSAQTDYRALSVAERLELVADIWDSIAADAPAPKLTASERAELRRRLDAHAADPGSALSWDRVRADMHQRAD